MFFKKYKIGFFIFGLILLPIYIYGQDLGSSTDILKTPNKKSPVKRKSSTPVRKKSPPVTARKKVKRKTPAKEATTAKIISEPEKKETPTEKVVDIKPANKLVITVGDKNSGDFNEQFEKAIEEGNNERNGRNYVQAETAYLRAQSLKSNDSRSIYGLGNLYSDQGRWEEAEKAYRSAIQIDPLNPDAYIALSFVLTQPIAGTNLIERYAEAEKLTRRAIELDSENAVAYDQLGVSLELQGNITEETQNLYQQAVKLDPTMALAYAHLGRLLRKKGLTNESSLAYVNSIQYSVDIPTMILVADVMQSQQRYVDSEQLLRRALRQDPKNPTALYLLGRALTTRGSYEEAETVLKKSAEVSPKSFVSYTLLGSLFLRQGKFETAENYLEEAIKVVSPNEQKRLALAFEAVGDGYLESGKKQDAVRVYRKAVSLDEKRVDLVSKLNKTQAK
jgi:tetratricopeptide (TPR) repeat protein